MLISSGISGIRRQATVASGVIQQQSLYTPTPALTATPFPSLLIRPIFTESEAIDRALELFPNNHSPNGMTARLVTLDTVNHLTNTDGSDFQPHVPVWLVAVLGVNLTMSDAIDIPGVEPANQTSPIGIYYVFDANSGEVIIVGAITNQTGYNTIANLQMQPLPIASATAWNFIVPTIDPTILPTLEP